MSTPTPSGLLAVHVAADPSGITATFTLGDPLELPQSAGWFTYGIELTGADGATVKHFGVRLSDEETKAFVFEFESATQANYDVTHVTDRGASLVARFPDSSPGSRTPRSAPTRSAQSPDSPPSRARTSPPASPCSCCADG